MNPWIHAAKIILAIWLGGAALWTPIHIGLSVWVKEEQPGKAWLGGFTLWSILIVPLAACCALIGCP